ncbi:MAG: hypothetical protein ABEJ31_08045 [Haloarculaceae archaeon]
MGGIENQPRTVVACVECGSTYVGVTLQDDTLQPLGIDGTCPDCGCRDFEQVEDVVDSPGNEPRGAGDPG